MEDASLGNKKIALALGSGSARGMAHIGVIQRLGELGIQPDIICGTSIGSVIAGCYLTGKLENFTDWIQSLSTTQVLHYMSVSLTATGGVAHATRLIEFFINEYGNPDIEDLNMPFAAVATDLMRGREVWLQRGPLWDAVRASMAIPGILTPVAFGNSWLVDGGLVNPVPVSVCRALGADIIIGVDLNSDLVGRQKVLTDAKAPANEETIEEEESENSINWSLFDEDKKDNLSGKEIINEAIDINEIEVIDYIELIPTEEKNEIGEVIHEMEDHMLFEPLSELSENSTLVENSDSIETEVETEVKEEIVSEIPTSDEEIDPLNTSIEDLQKQRSKERRLRMKEFNYKFNNSKIDEIEKVPAYKRQGVDLEETKHSSEEERSRFTLDLDENEDIQLRKNNSFLHDNVD